MIKDPDDQHSFYCSLGRLEELEILMGHDYFNNEKLYKEYIDLFFEIKKDLEEE